MKEELCILIAGMILAIEVNATAAIRYVDQNSTSPTPPYTNWATAAHVIQDAVEAAATGDEIVVTNGIYATGGRAVYGTMTNRVAVDKPLTLRSVNGPQVTVIRGYQLPGTTNGDGAIRCVYLTNGASLSGFTLTNGATRTGPGILLFEQSGGGVFCDSTDTLVSNCILVRNSAALELENLLEFPAACGGGAFGGTLNNCTLAENSAYKGGGACSSTLNACIVSGNWAPDSGGGGQDDILNGCTLTGNMAVREGGGASGGIVNNCTISGNSAGQGGGAAKATLNNCALTGNSGGGAFAAILNNCTVTGNSGFGVFGFCIPMGGCGPAAAHNCIVYFNEESDIGPFAYLDNCCTRSTPDNGFGNITNAPLFVNLVAGDFRLQSNSPCINAGNNAFARTGFDLDGNPRTVGGTVDIGAYEFQTPTSVISYAWLQKYGLPTDGSADSSDPDHDGLNNWQEWRCLTEPTNAHSALRLTSGSATNTNVTVIWQSVAGVNYFLERSTNLGAQPVFTQLATGIPGQAGTTSYIDSTAAGPGPFFYRVGVGN